ncbi:unnamed protein product [Arabis nemorensis]|uniref:Uncharacterized protein n=1 Tax=Arabis nemorensis TaxID=586526 RepID=A0A565CWC4_9BRAS|nr:unnamed protein product [Arabis nemorensis]
MESWGVEVKAGNTYTAPVLEDELIHISRAVSKSDDNDGSHFEKEKVVSSFSRRISVGKKKRKNERGGDYFTCLCFLEKAGEGESPPRSFFLFFFPTDILPSSV